MRRAHRTFRSISLLLLASSWSAAARAETVVLLGALSADAPVQHSEAERALSRALHADGVRIMTQQEAETRVGGAAAVCTGPECTAELVRGAGADAAVSVSLTTSPNAVAAAPTVLITFVDRAGQRFPGKARVIDGDFDQAAREALVDARALQLLGRGPWLRVSSNPDGAQVLLDGRPIGSTPTRAAVHAGRHTLEIRREGVRPHAQTVDVPPDATRQIEINADLTPRGRGVAPRARAPRTQAISESSHDGPVLGPVILGSVGVALLAYEVAHVGSDLCANRGMDGLCEARSPVARTPAIILGAVGGGAMLGAVLWHMFGGSAHGETPVALSANSVHARVRF